MDHRVDICGDSTISANLQRFPNETMTDLAELDDPLFEQWLRDHLAKPQGQVT